MLISSSDDAIIPSGRSTIPSAFAAKLDAVARSVAEKELVRAGKSRMSAEGIFSGQSDLEECGAKRREAEEDG